MLKGESQEQNGLPESKGLNVLPEQESWGQNCLPEQESWGQNCLPEQE